jgi:dipeptidyl aminopeptidase/acylaminoacyl peptidase
MKLSTRPRRAITNPRIIAACTAAGCAAAVLAATGTAAARTGATSSPARPDTPLSVTAAAAANGRIAFSQWDLLPGGNLSGHSNVYTINPDGTGLRQLTHVGATQAAGAPDWSPVGDKIVYESNQTGDYRIWVMNADGSGQTRLADDPGFVDLEPAWSPDGTRILFSRCDDHIGFILSCDLEVMNAAGTGMRRLAGGHWTYVRGQYSPDGRHIVVAADRGGFLSALWVMRADGTGLHRITRPSLQAFWPGWSPDGRRIIFTDNCCQSGSNIWTVRPDGTGLRELTHFSPAPLQGGFASYSPGGQRIVLQFNGKCPVRGICQYFYVMNADGSGLHAVRTGVANTFLTDWGPAR